MSTLSTKFINWYHNEFRHDPLFVNMQHTTENSKYHRESSVACHTDMVVAQYLVLSVKDFQWNHTDLNAGLAAAFHDVGKPVTAEAKYSVARGKYVSFNQHERASARLWEDYAVRNWKVLRDLFSMTPNDIYSVGWMIENHRPWGLIKNDKLNMLCHTITAIASYPSYTNLLLADTYGRISDDPDQRDTNCHTWISMLNDRYNHLSDTTTLASTDAPIFTVVIGASGSGKTTYAEKQQCTIFSLDELRTRWYGEDYDKAFTSSCNSGFNSDAHKEFVSLIKEHHDLTMDGVNSSKKSRRSHLVLAREHGYRLRAVVIPTDLQTIINRQQTRTDKTIPESVVRRQYSNITYPSLGEFDEIEVYDGNLK